VKHTVPCGRSTRCSGRARKIERLKPHVINGLKREEVIAPDAPLLHELY
jgi:hypothetical protein